MVMVHAINSALMHAAKPTRKALGCAMQHLRMQLNKTRINLERLFKLFAMRFQIYSIVWLTGFILVSAALNSQSCGSDFVHQHMMQKNDYRRIYESEQRSIYERSITASQLAQRAGDFCGGIKTIPVVVHVMHLGEAIGNGTNISDTQIQQAIDGANNYWRNLNATGIADMEIQFELAKRDPNGNASNGIVRVNASSVPGYSATGVTLDAAGCPGPIDTDIKVLSFWPVADYYNIWVINDICQGYAGFAYYPFGDWYDGAMVLAQYMTFDDKTLTHELGHAFNLAHTFEGDNNGTTCPDNTDCLLNGDQVCDTPPHTIDDCDLTNNCSTIGNWTFSRSNFMSYCFNDPMLFTPGQKNRAQLASEGAIRSPLIFSEALIPVGQPREAGILSIDSPDYLVCSSQFDPEILVKNYGTTAIQSIACEIFIDGVSTGIYEASISIAPGQQGAVVLQNCPITNGEHLLEISLTSLNNQALDAYLGNNALCKSILFSSIEALPLCENFETTLIPDFLSVNNPDGISGWELKNVTGCAQTNGNKSIAYNGSQGAFGGPTSDELLLLPFDLSNATSATLDFRIAEKQTFYCNTYMTLQVEASTDCGQTFTPLYTKNDAYTITSNCGGPSQCPCTQASALPLYTTSGNFIPSEQTPWLPVACTDWRNESINLNAYLNASSVIIKFKATKADWQSNNLYLDNLCVNATYNPLKNGMDISPKFSFKVFPNPSTGNFKLFGSAHSGETIQYRVVNSAGQLVQTGAITANDNQLQTDISMAEFSSGIYTLQLFSASRTQTLKIIHQNP